MPIVHKCTPEAKTAYSEVYLGFGFRHLQNVSILVTNNTPPNWTLGKCEGPMTGEALHLFPGCDRCYVLNIRRTVHSKLTGVSQQTSSVIQRGSA